MTKKANIFILLCFIAQLLAIFISFIFVSDLKELHLLKLGFFDFDNYFISLTQIILIPLFLLLVFLLKKNTIFLRIFSVILSCMFFIRGFILIDLLISLNNNLETNSFDFFYYIQIALFVFIAFSVIFFIFSLKKLSKVFLKASSISGIVLYSLLFLVFIISYFFLNEQFNGKVLFLILSIIIVDLFNFIELFIIKQISNK